MNTLRALLLVSLGACSNDAASGDAGATTTDAGAMDGVGQPCLPEQVPDTGFDRHEAYIESSSVQCSTGACIVNGLLGDPRPDCDSSSAAGGRCATPVEVEDTIYCTCECQPSILSPSPESLCTCPEAFVCSEIGYCVRDAP